MKDLKKAIYLISIVLFFIFGSILLVKLSQDDLVKMALETKHCYYNIEDCFCESGYQIEGTGLFSEPKYYCLGKQFVCGESSCNYVVQMESLQ